MSDHSVPVASNLSQTNYFIYKEKQYPFNIDLFNLFSRYFSSSQQIQPNSGIMLMNETDDDINIPDESIKDFISYCQYQQINLTTNNVQFVYILAKKFNVPSLIKKTEDFIFEHEKNLVVEFLIISNYHQEIDTQKYEEIIAHDLIEYIKDDKLISLPLPILHRIIRKYQIIIQKNNSKNEIPSEFIEFLFKCLDHYGQKASVLFSNFNFGR